MNNTYRLIFSEMNQGIREKIAVVVSGEGNIPSLVVSRQYPTHNRTTNTSLMRVLGNHHHQRFHLLPLFG